MCEVAERKRRAKKVRKVSGAPVTAPNRRQRQKQRQEGGRGRSERGARVAANKAHAICYGNCFSSFHLLSFNTDI